MPEGVAEIEQGALAGFALVARHRNGLGTAARRDRMLARRPAREQVAPIGVEPGEECGVVDQAIFDDFGVASAEVARRQRVEQSGIGDHQDRLVESADEILAVDRIDAGLAAHRGIHLGEQRCWHLHDLEPAPHDRGRKPGKIADHAAAKRNDEIVALDPGGENRLADPLDDPPGLGAFAGRHDDAGSTDAGARKRRLGGGEMMARHGFVRHDRGGGTRPQLGDARAELGQQTAPDRDVVTARAECDVDDGRIGGAKRRGHDGILLDPGPPARLSRPKYPASAANVSLTIVSCGTSRDTIVRSASA